MKTTLTQFIESIEDNFGKNSIPKKIKEEFLRLEESEIKEACSAGLSGVPNSSDEYFKQRYIK